MFLFRMTNIGQLIRDIYETWQPQRFRNHESQQQPESIQETKKPTAGRR